MHCSLNDVRMFIGYAGDHWLALLMDHTRIDLQQVSRHRRQTHRYTYRPAFS